MLVCPHTLTSAHMHIHAQASSRKSPKGGGGENRFSKNFWGVCTVIMSFVLLKFHGGEIVKGGKILSRGAGGGRPPLPPPLNEALMHRPVCVCLLGPYAGFTCVQYKLN